VAGSCEHCTQHSGSIKGVSSPSDGLLPLKNEFVRSYSVKKVVSEN
jgi:hypothetical protein